MEDFFSKYPISEKTIAVGVSGGADSLALVLRLHEFQKKVVALTVDHGLRPDSYQEAEYVASIMAKFGIEHHILIWQGEKPQTGIEEAAREARYQLMIEFCRQNDIKYLAIGHHLRDQAETFLLRLARGSGVFGLSSILPLSQRDDITIIRPQLSDSPEDLRQYLINKNIKWIEDPMNDSDEFTRVKIRKFLPQLKEIGIDEKRLADTAFVLSQTREFLQNKCDEFISACVRWYGLRVASVSINNLKTCEKEIMRLAIGQLIQQISRKNYLPSAKALEEIIDNIIDFKGCTLGGCELEVAMQRLWIMPQNTTKEIMSSKQWDDFVSNHQDFRNSGLPYKVRFAIKNNWEC